VKKAIEKLYNKIVRSCSQCKGEGVFLKGGEFAYCICMERFQKEVALLRSNIPKRYRDFTLRNLTSEFKQVNEKPLLIIRSYIDHLSSNIEQGNGLFFQSMPGLAKTALSCYILLQALRIGIHASFIRYEDLINLFFKQLNYKDVDIDAVNEKLDYIQNCSIICIDRIDKGHVEEGSYVYQRLDAFFSRLYDENKSLLVTSSTPRNKMQFPFMSFLEDLVDIVFTGTPFRDSSRTLDSIMKKNR